MLRLPRQFAPAAVLAAACLSATCAFPTDTSNQVTVSVATNASVVLRGLQPLSVSAQAWRHLSPSDSVPLANVQFEWISSDKATATVDAGAGTSGAAQVTGIKRGSVTVTARVMGYDKAGDGAVTLRVADPLEIDTIFPDSVRWGEKLTVVGIGVRGIQLGFINGALVRDTFSFPDAPALKVDTAEFFVPPPSRNGPFIAASADAFVVVPRTIGVDTADLYEPNDTIAATIDLDGPVPYPAHPGILFYNPALAYERPPLGSFNQLTDYYNFTRADTTQALTVIYKPELVNDTSLTYTYLVDSLDQSGGGFFLGPDTHFLFGPGTGLYVCDTMYFFANELVADSIIEPLSPVPTSQLHLLSFFRVPGHYGVTIRQGYHTQLPPDHFEPNDLWCRNPDTSHVTVALGAPAFVDTTLTIDRPHDLDWYRIHIPDANDTLVIRAVARPAGGAPADLDIYLMSGDMLSEIASSFNVGLADSLIVPLVAAGDYVVGVIDFPGVTTKYDLCVTVNTPCTGLHPSPTRRIVGASAKMARKSRATTRPPGTPVAGPASRLWGMRFSPHP